MDPILFIFIQISSSLLLSPVTGEPISPAAPLPPPLIISASDLLLKPLHHTVSPLPIGNPLNQICEKTDYPIDCAVSIAPFQTGATDPISVLKMEMQALRRGFENASSAAGRIDGDPATSAAVRDRLDVCRDLYESGVYELDDALNAIAEYDAPKLRSVLSAAVSDIEGCDEAFRETPGVGSPLTAVNGELAKLASNNLAIANAFFQ